MSRLSKYKYSRLAWLIRIVLALLIGYAAGVIHESAAQAEEQSRAGRILQQPQQTEVKIWSV